GRKERKVGPQGEGRSAALTRPLHRYRPRMDAMAAFLSQLHMPLSVSSLDQMSYQLEDWAGDVQGRSGTFRCRPTHAGTPTPARSWRTWGRVQAVAADAPHLGTGHRASGTCGRSRRVRPDRDSACWTTGRQTHHPQAGKSHTPVR